MTTDNAVWTYLPNIDIVLRLKCGYCSENEERTSCVSIWILQKHDAIIFFIYGCNLTHRFKVHRFESTSIDYSDHGLTTSSSRWRNDHLHRALNLRTAWVGGHKHSRNMERDRLNKQPTTEHNGSLWPHWYWVYPPTQSGVDDTSYFTTLCPRWSAFKYSDTVHTMFNDRTNPDADDLEANYVFPGARHFP